jgi:hypothetical protein
VPSPKSQARQATPISAGSREQSTSWIVSLTDGARGLTVNLTIGVDDIGTPFLGSGQSTARRSQIANGRCYVR